VNQLPPASAGPDLFLCPSPTNSVILTGSGGLTYAWSPNINLSDSTLANPVANPDSTQIYVVLVTDTNGCKTTDSVEVLVFPIVPVDAGFNRTICLKDSITLGGVPTAPPGSTFLWSPSTGLDNATLANPKASPAVTTTYIVKVTNDTCRGTDTVVVFVNPIPNAVVGSNRNLCINDSTIIGSTEVIGNTYSWISIPVGFTDTTSNPSVKPTVTTTYILTETIAATGCFKTDSITISVLQLPIVSAGADKTICIGSPVTIGGAPTGPAGSTFSWSPVLGLTNVTNANPSASPALTSTYIVRVTDSFTCVNTDTVTVNVNQLPIVSAGADKQLCLNDTIAIGGSPTGPLNSTFVWTNPASLINATASNPLAHPSVSTNYIVTVTDTNSCVNKDTMRVNVNLLPVINAGTNRSICFRDSTLIGGLPIAPISTFSWSPSAGLSSTSISQPQASPAVTTDYILTVTSITTTCVNRDTVTVTVLPLPFALTGPDVPICIGDSIRIGDVAVLGNTYSWSPALGLNSTTVSNPFAKPTATTTYVLTETNTLTGCFKIDSVVVTVNPLPLATVTAAQTICLLQTVSIGGAPVAGNTYSWTPSAGLTNSTDANPGASPTVTTTYLLTETVSATGCFKKDSVVVNVNPLPPANGGLDKVICFGKSVQIGDTAVSGNTYLWTPASSLTSATLSNPIANPTQTTAYLLTETITNTGCQKQDSVTVTVNPLPVVTVVGNSGVCSGDSIQLLATGGSSFLWFPSTGLSSAIIPNPKASPADTITYHVVVTTLAGCVDSTTILVNVNPLPVASATTIYTPSCDGLKAAYTNTSTISNSENLTYEWNFGDNFNSTEESPEHTFDYGQTYTTTLTVISQNNCKSLFNIVNDVQLQKDNVKIELANVITPNGDGVNDCFNYKADGKFDECSELWVFNRWGKEIFKSSNSEICWDGKDKNGNVVENGVYFYIYKIQDFKQNGNINVYR
jgi:gliding motility-associated-like protein